MSEALPRNVKHLPAHPTRPTSELDKVAAFTERAKQGEPPSSSTFDLHFNCMIIVTLHDAVFFGLVGCTDKSENMLETFVLSELLSKYPRGTPTGY